MISKDFATIKIYHYFIANVTEFDYFCMIVDEWITTIANWILPL